MAIYYVDTTGTTGAPNDPAQPYPDFASVPALVSGDSARFRGGQVHNWAAQYSVPQANITLEDYQVSDYDTIGAVKPLEKPQLLNTSGSAIIAILPGSGDSGFICRNLFLNGNTVGWNVNGAISQQGADFRLDGLEIENAGRTCIYVTGNGMTGGGTVANCRFLSNYSITNVNGAISLDGAGTETTPVFIRDNNFFANIRKTRTGDNGDVSDDIYGIVLKGACSYARIYNNQFGDPDGTIDNAPVTGIMIDSSSNNNHITNNKAYFCWNNGTYIGNGTGTGIRTRSTYTGHSNSIIGNYVSQCFSGIVLDGASPSPDTNGGDIIVGNVIHHVNLNGIDLRDRRTSLPTNPIRCEFNTVIHKPGVLDGDAAGGVGHGIDIQQSGPPNTSATDFIIRNNCVLNEYDTPAPNNCQCFSISSDFAGELTMDRNHYFVETAGQVFGRLGGTDYTTLASYQAALAGATQNIVGDVTPAAPEQLATEDNAYINHITGEILSTLSPLFRTGTKYWGNEPRPNTNGDPLPDRDLDRGGHQSRMSLGHTIRT